MKTPKMDRPGWTALVLLVAVALTAAGCGGSAPGAATRAPGLADAPIGAAPTGPAAKELLVTTLKAQLAQKAWQVAVSLEDSGVKSTSRIEFISPDRFHAVDPDGSEMIVVRGAGTFERAPGGQWQRSATDMSDSVLALMDPQQNQSLGEDLAVEQVKFLGADVLSGKPMWIYQYQATNNFGNVPATYTTKIWIGVSDKLPYKEESEGESATVKGGRMKQTIVYGYSTSIRIEPPIK